MAKTLSANEMAQGLHSFGLNVVKVERKQSRSSIIKGVRATPEGKNVNPNRADHILQLGEKFAQLSPDRLAQVINLLRQYGQTKGPL